MSKPKLSWDEFIALLEQSKLTRAEFCELSGVPYGTTNSWQQRPNTVPAWVPWALENYRSAQQVAALRSMLAATTDPTP